MRMILKYSVIFFVFNENILKCNMLAQVVNLFNRVSSLPEVLQANLAVFWSDDIENEINFDNRIYVTSDKLKILAQEALNDFKSGKTLEKVFDEL
jgi:hypothetical protein